VGHPLVPSAHIQKLPGWLLSVPPLMPNAYSGDADQRFRPKPITRSG
jgi:hypothetical protein